MNAYISIPITGHDIDVQKAKSEEVRRALQLGGYTAMTPFDLDMGEDKTDAYYMGRCIEALLQCDTIFMCDGWQKSKGCRTERFTAQEYGLLVMHQCKE